MLLRPGAGGRMMTDGDIGLMGDVCVDVGKEIQISYGMVG
jgi:hypothetical protein